MLNVPVTLPSTSLTVCGMRRPILVLGDPVDNVAYRSGGRFSVLRLGRRAKTNVRVTGDSLSTMPCDAAYESGRMSPGKHNLGESRARPTMPVHSDHERQAS